MAKRDRGGKIHKKISSSRRSLHVLAVNRSTYNANENGPELRSRKDGSTRGWAENHSMEGHSRGSRECASPSFLVSSLFFPSVRASQGGGRIAQINARSKRGTREKEAHDRNVKRYGRGSIIRGKRAERGSENCRHA